MISTLLMVVAALALFIAAVAFVMATIALILVYGMKNSTHQVVWKNVTPPEENNDPFAVDREEEEVGENPNKKLNKTKKVKAEDDVDLSDPTVTSNDWD